MKRLWLLFSQTITVLVAAWFVVATLQPGWLRGVNLPGRHSISLLEAPPTNPAEPMPGSLSGAARKAAPAVVSINTSKAPVRDPHSDDPWFQFFFGDQANRPQAGLGSGVIVSPEGYILTNNHVVDGADEIDVTLSDGRKARATVIGTDPETDLAILKIELDKLPVIVLGDSDTALVGDRVLAIGNPFGVGQTIPSRISSRPTLPSTLATRAARWWTSTAICWESTPPSIPAPVAAWALVSPFLFPRQKWCSAALPPRVR